jgi:hypothetical protein
VWLIGDDHEVLVIDAAHDATAILEEAKTIQAHLQAQDAAISRIIDRLEAVPGASAG